MICLSNSHDGRYAVTGGGNGWNVGELRLWNVVTGQLLHDFRLQVIQNKKSRETETKQAIAFRFDLLVPLFRVFMSAVLRMLL